MPIRVITRMEAATYGESVISTPSWEIGEPSGPMQNGTTYMVRPAMLPANSSANVARISAGAIQLLVGPASSSRSEQMKVRSSTRATSEGSERARKLPGRSSGLSGRNVPSSTRRLVSWSHSSWEPSHHCTRAGWVRAAMSVTQSIRPLCAVGGCCSPGIASLTGCPPNSPAATRNSFSTGSQKETGNHLNKMHSKPGGVVDLRVWRFVALSSRFCNTCEDDERWSRPIR